MNLNYEAKSQIKSLIILLLIRLMIAQCLRTMSNKYSPSLISVQISHDGGPASAAAHQGPATLLQHPQTAQAQAAALDAVHRRPVCEAGVQAPPLEPADAVLRALLPEVGAVRAAAGQQGRPGHGQGHFLVGGEQAHQRPEGGPAETQVRSAEGQEVMSAVLMMEYNGMQSRGQDLQLNLPVIKKLSLPHPINFNTQRNTRYFAEELLKDEARITGMRTDRIHHQPQPRKMPTKHTQSTPKLQKPLPDPKKKERYHKNVKLSIQLRLPSEGHASDDSSDEETKQKLTMEEGYQRISQPSLVVLRGNSQYNKIPQRQNSATYMTDNQLTDSRLTIHQNNISMPVAPTLPSLPTIYASREERYVREKLVGEEAVSKFYGRYKNIQKVRDMEEFNSELNPLTVILTILQSYNIPPKRMEVIKIKGEEATLDLNNCALGSGLSIRAVSEIVAKVEVFECIDLSWNNIHADLCDVIVPHLAKMRVINMSYNKIGRRGVELINEMLSSEENQQELDIEQLNLESNSIGDTAIGSMFSHLLEMNTLMVLNLSKNYLGSYTAARLKDYLMNDNWLAELYLHWAELGSKGTRMIFEGASRNHSLKVLDLSWNQICLDTIPAFCSFVKQNDSLVHLDISFCEIDEKDTRIMAKALKENHTIYGLHYQGNLGYTDFKGYLHSLRKEQRHIPVSIRAGLVQRIDGVNIVRDRQNPHETAVHRDVCWICEGWEERYFKVPKTYREKACFLHLQFEHFNGTMMKSEDKHYELLRMCPPKAFKYFITRINEDGSIIHETFHSCSQSQIVDYHYSLPDFTIEDKVFADVRVGRLNKAYQPHYYSQLFNEDYLTKVHCIPRSNDLKGADDLLNDQSNRKPKPAKKVKKKNRSNENDIRSKLKKEISIKQIPREFDNMFLNNKGMGEGIQTKMFYRQCVDFDITHSKVPKMVKRPEQLALVRDVLEQNYELFAKIYYYLTNNNPNVNGIFSISQTRFEKFIEEQGYETKRMTKAKIRLKLITTLTGKGQSQSEDPMGGFYRPQFFEFLLRVAIEKWCHSIPKKQNETEEERIKREKFPYSINDALAKMLKTLKKYEQKADAEIWRQQNLTTYEISIVMKSYNPVLEKIYEKYAGMNQKNLSVRSRKKLLLDEFKIMLMTAEIRKTRQALKDLDVAYRSAKKLEIQDGIADTGLDHLQFLETLCRFAEGLPLRPLGSESHPLWEKDLIPPDEVPLFLKVQKLIKEIYLKNFDLQNKKLNTLFEHGLFPQEIEMLMTHFKDKYEAGRDWMRKTSLFKNLKMNSLEGGAPKKVTLQFLLAMLRVKAQEIMEQNRKLLKEIIQEDEQEHNQSDHDNKA